MEKVSRRQFIKAAAAAGTLAAVSASPMTASACFTAQAPAGGFAQTAVISGFAWGPGVTATILELAQPVRAGSVRAEDFVVTESKEAFDWATFAPAHITSSAPREVTGACVCTSRGVPTSLPSRYIRLELACDPNSGSPFCYDLYTSKNTWCDPYTLTVELAPGAALTTVTGKTVTALDADPAISYANALIPEMDAFDTTGVFTGSDGKTLTYASYKPSALRGGKLPLVIWLHGAGEGGTDPSLLLLGNEVTPLAEAEFQAAMGGAAYILTPQTPGFWLEWEEDPSTWSANPGKPSVYTQTLKELIDAFVAENPRIDPDRILIGGCSNGGYMAFNMALRYPDYFAAAYPICEAYNDAGISDAELAAVKELPLWFVYAENDTVVPPASCEIPTIARLKAMGANVHTSIFADVHDTTGLYKQADGSAYQYQGHWSWTYFFRNECIEDTTGENMWSWLSAQSR